MTGNVVSDRGCAQRVVRIRAADSYCLAYEDRKFLASDDLRSVRL